jgi:hypothetical protein
MKVKAVLTLFKKIKTYMYMHTLKSENDDTSAIEHVKKVFLFYMVYCIILSCDNLPAEK